MTDLIRSVPSDIDMSPRAIGRYLGSSGWSVVNDTPAFQLWEAPDHLGNLLLPLDATYVDYATRMNEALSQLCSIHDWDAMQLATHVAGARSDFLYIRADQYSPDGSIPLSQAEALLSGASRMLYAAACSAVRPRANFSGRRPDVAREFFNEVRMGHTQRGSFVITILTRLGASDAGPSADGEDSASAGGPTDLDTSNAPQLDADGHSQTSAVVPFERQVMATLATGVAAARSLALGSHDGTLEDAIERGVSSELVSAIEAMTDYQGLRSLDLSFDWAPSEQSSIPDVDSVIRIDRDVLPGLPELAERLARKSPTPEPNAQVFGRVTRLERGVEDDEGTVTIHGTMDGVSGARTVRIAVTGKLYNAAIRAHRNRTPVVAEGTLTRQSNGWWLTGDVTLS